MASSPTKSCSKSKVYANYCRYFDGGHMACLLMDEVAPLSKPVSESLIPHDTHMPVFGVNVHISNSLLSSCKSVHYICEQNVKNR